MKSRDAVQFCTIVFANLVIFVSGICGGIIAGLYLRGAQQTALIAIAAGLAAIIVLGTVMVKKAFNSRTAMLTSVIYISCAVATMSAFLGRLFIALIAAIVMLVCLFLL